MAGELFRRHSLWLDTLAAPFVPRAPLQHDVAADVVVVGAGFIGLWTAYCLARAGSRRSRSS